MINLKDLNIFILAGGFGKRLKSVVSHVPKPMAPINHKPFLSYKIDMIREYLPDNQIYLLTHYMSDIIEGFFKDQYKINFIKEEKPMGTGGSLKNAIKILNLKDEDRIMLMNGDTYIEPNYLEFIENASKDINMMTAIVNDCSRFNTLEIKNDRVIRFNKKYSNAINKNINIGCYLFNNLKIIKNIQEKYFSLEDKFVELVNLTDIKSFNYQGRFIDIGTPDDYEKLINEKNNEK